MEKRNSKNTNDATKQWMSCISTYLIEKVYPKLESLLNEPLDKILESFYVEVKKKIPNDGQSGTESNYKASSLRALQAALAHYFKKTRGIDLIQNEIFIKSNDMFKAITAVNKQDGLGEVVSFPPIEDGDMRKLTESLL